MIRDVDHDVVRTVAMGRTATTIRRLILGVSAVLLAVGLYRIGRSFVAQGKIRFGNPVGQGGPFIDDPIERSVAPRRVRAEVTRVRGKQVVSPGARCEFLVEKRPLKNGTFYCNAQVSCGGTLLYGGPDRGYFACALYDEPRRDIVGSDPSTTSQDHDPAIKLDTQAGVLRIWDDAQGPLGDFAVEAEVLSVD